MSADNGIYILETGTDVKQYRVAHLMAVENYQWDDGRECYTDDPDVHIENARNMWSNCFAYSIKELAVIAAVKLAKQCPVLEYGIGFISIPREFEKTVDQVAER